MRLLLAAFCEHASSTPEGRLDLHGVFNDLFAPGFPARQDHVVLALTLEWAREDSGRYTFRVDLVGPDGRPSLTIEGHSDVDPRPGDGPPARTQLIMPLETVIFPAPGPYRLRVRVKGQELEGPTLHLTRRDTAPQ
jgi:hypothetical protein